MQPLEIYYRKIVLRNKVEPQARPLEFVLPPTVECWAPAEDTFEIVEDVYVTYDKRSGPWSEVADSLARSNGRPADDRRAAA